MTMTGTFINDQYTLSPLQIPSGQIPSVNLGGFTLASGTLTLNSAGLNLVGQVSVPGIGNEPVQGSIQDSTHYSLSSGQLPSVTFGSFTLTSDSITLSDAGAIAASIAFSGRASLPLFNTVNFAGTISPPAGNTYSITAQPGPTSLFGGLVHFSYETLTLTPTAVTLTGRATVNNILDADFSGSLYANETYNVSAVTGFNIAGYTVSNATLTLADPLTASFTLDVPQIGKVDFSGSYDSAIDQWSLGGQLHDPSLEPVSVGP